MWTGVLLGGLLAGGCQLSARSQSGGAIAKPGVSGGTMNSIYFEDTGGPLSQIIARTSLLLLGGVAAVGAATGGSVSSSTSSSGIYDSSGNRTGTRETTTYTGGTPDAAGGRAAQGVIDAASSRDLDVSGFTSGLEIASTKLGGDTSGWFLDAGFKSVTNHGSWGLRLVLKTAYGKVTQHDRTIRTFDESFVSETMGDATYTFGGARLGLGVSYRRVVELYAQIDLNTVGWFNPLRNDSADGDESPSPWSIGARATLGRGAFVQAAVMASRLDGEHTSTMLEVGVELSRRKR